MFITSQLDFFYKVLFYVTEAIFLVEKSSSSLTLWTSRHIEKN